MSRVETKNFPAGATGVGLGGVTQREQNPSASDGAGGNQPETRTGPHRASGETNSGTTGDSELTRSARTPSEALVEAMKVCAFYDFDGVEMVECKWATWGAILNAIQAMQSENDTANKYIRELEVALETSRGKADPEDIEALKRLADSMGFGRTHDMLRRVIAASSTVSSNQRGGE